MPRLGVCSWSLRPTSPRDLVTKLEATGLRAVQLALEPLRTGAWSEAETVHELRAAGITLLSGMMETAGEDYATLDTIRVTGGVRPATTWERNRSSARENAALARRLGLRLVTFHAGFLPHDPRDTERAVMLGRLAEIARTFAEQGVAIALETGQESAATLLPVLAELASVKVGVNFDPANMILYGMGDPVAAFEALAPHVRQVHVKDALPTTQPGTWGTEVPVGTGKVAWERFLKLVRHHQPGIDLAIEREAGERRVEDIRSAKELVTRLVGKELAS